MHDPFLEADHNGTAEEATIRLKVEHIVGITFHPFHQTTEIFQLFTVVQASGMKVFEGASFRAGMGMRESSGILGKTLLQEIQYKSATALLVPTDWYMKDSCCFVSQDLWQGHTTKALRTLKNFFGLVQIHSIKIRFILFLMILNLNSNQNGLD